MCLSGYEPWRRFEKDYDAGNKQDYYQAKDQAADQLIATVEKAALPGLSKMVVMREVATPLTNRRFTLNPEGAIYGYSQTLDNSFLRRLPNPARRFRACTSPAPGPCPAAATAARWPRRAARSRIWLRISGRSTRDFFPYSRTAGIQPSRASGIAPKYIRVIA